MVLAVGIFATFHPGRTLAGPESEFSKLIVQKGQRRWWCCGRRVRTKLDPDFDHQRIESRSGSALGGEEIRLVRRDKTGD